MLVARDPADGTIFYGKNSEYRIHAVDAAGRPVTTFGIDILSRSGEYLYQGTLAFEAGKHLFGNPDNLRIQDDHLLAVLEGASGRRSIARYALKLPLPQ